ncbi:UDP-GlcNAc:betaGal beta-1,3-N-acetylglucosaminyltransferase-like protein 1 [Uloborus diversus]|uniref:UDP-GlcNAc:betaGal beta-1,3-N-acetylglucosaminyltransferase-like protein 1 n=1 Tax=Uloborus diversus TaxID=327109 RepID=UPI00240A0672|nr:UDP-GlcNAc:betaGal beta-1,3-N-acetylglucosaminyltransferase-like protein 1 [Uloborus diversus]
MTSNKIDVSIIVPVYNGDLWLEECLTSVVAQDFPRSLELSVFNDASNDKSMDILTSWSSKIIQRGIKYTLVNSLNSHPKGVGYAKNKAVEQSTGEYLCFLDCDDVMNRSRIRKQYEACCSRDDAIVGCQFHREPPDSTPRYVQWANNLESKQLYIQIYTSFGPTIVMPTWFCHRSVFKKVKGFSEKGKGTPEDLLFFYEHLRLGGNLLRVEEDLLLYRYHLAATTFSVTEETLWEIRMQELERNVLTKWKKFTIWNAGKQGRKFFRSLSQVNRLKVQAFCDVDFKKLEKGVYIHEESKLLPKPKIPIVHFTKADPPFILCIKIDMTGGNFEKNLTSLNLTEGIDYYHFS